MRRPIHCNPLGVTTVDGGESVARNGNNMDRVRRVRRGRNCAWNGVDLAVARAAGIRPRRRG